MRFPRIPLLVALLMFVVLCITQTAEARGRLGGRINWRPFQRVASAPAATPVATPAVVPAAIVAPSANPTAAQLDAVKTKAPIVTAPAAKTPAKVEAKTTPSKDLKFDPVPIPVKIPAKTIPMTTPKPGSGAEIQKSREGGYKVGTVTLTRGEENMLDEMNRQRIARGIRPIAPDEQLMLSARRHATWMASTRRMQHASNVIETIAMNGTNTVAAIGQWIRSTPHRNIMLSPNLLRVGLAGYINSGGRSYYAAQYGR